jgi:glutaredoxin 3
MGAAERIVVVSVFIAALGLSGCELDTSELLAADQLIERVNAGSSDGGIVTKKIDTGISLGPESATRIYYQFVDSQGQVRFVDRLGDIPEAWRDRVGFVELESPPPLSPMESQQTRTNRSAGMQVAAGSRSGASSTVVFYTAAWCPWCSKAKSHMDREGIDYESRDIDNPAILAELIEKTGQQGVPVFDVGGRILTGFDPNRLEQLVASR